MKNKDYWGDSRYFKLWERMEMLGIKDVSSPCQEKNGTVVWRLPIKNTYSHKGEFIEVASYEAGYVRVLNTCMSPYYINKPIFRYITVNYSSKKPKLIPIEIERLEYLISYCLKNMYIKLANECQTLPARNEHLEYKVTDLNNELCRMDDKIIQLKQDIAITEANTELEKQIKDLKDQLDVQESLLVDRAEVISSLKSDIARNEDELVDIHSCIVYLMGKCN